MAGHSHCHRMAEMFVFIVTFPPFGISRPPHPAIVPPHPEPDPAPVLAGRNRDFGRKREGWPRPAWRAAGRQHWAWGSASPPCTTEVSAAHGGQNPLNSAPCPTPDLRSCPLRAPIGIPPPPCHPTGCHFPSVATAPQTPAGKDTWWAGDVGGETPENPVPPTHDVPSPPQCCGTISACSQVTW